MSEPPEAKRSKTSSILEEVLASNLLADDKAKEIQEQYASSQPYSHAQIKNLFHSKFLLSVKEEIKSQTKVNFKESDLFRVYQSIDLANLEPGSDLSKQLPNVMKLREVLYSQEWRSFIEKLCGLPPSTLVEKIDCACNCHAPGCHLLCHDDVIGTRKVSYIIYLTEEDWKQDEGGSLELYGQQLDNPTSKKQSSPIPLARAWPLFNSMAFFVVKPGESFHAVQEVTGERPRLSLQGWYHAAEPPKNMELATLQQLKADNDASKAGTDAEKTFDESEAKEFSDADKEYLSKYLVPEYLKEESMDEIHKKFENDSSVQLRNFLQDKWVPKMESRTGKKRANDMNHYMEGVSSEWKLRGPAHKQRYLEFRPQPSTTDCAVTGSMMHYVKMKVFESPVFARYLKRVTGLEHPTGIKESKIRRFRPGLDYTVAHYGLLVKESVLDATLCFVADGNEDDKAKWEYGDSGGFECYIEADEENEEGGNQAADEYNEDDDTELLSVSASNNTLSLVYRDPGTMRFVKYVGSSAPSSRFDIAMEYQVPEGEEDDDENADDDAEKQESEDVGF
ncbi:unnamed protein product [Cylindrotheca closterium]|uniref:Fe2OG dioxygenase domain-containing protein n=1 Tax=Cylindrotheca closterium TaxID=2856 RepID=A0AAD2G5K1_9STRA|nr:unnamed protein product [Cylindrotheca closterium]